MKGKFIATNIKAERRRLGWTQQKMADIGGVSKRSQVGYESGARVPDANYLVNVADSGANTVNILFGEDQPVSHARSFDWNAHDQILETIEDWLHSRQLQLPFEKKMQLLRLFIAHFEFTRQISLDYIHDTLKAAA